MENNRNIKRALLGMIILSLGAILLLDNFNVLDIPIRQYIFSWKTLLIVVGVAILSSSRKNTGGIILVSLGIIFWLPTIFEYQFSIKQIFLPSVFIILGFVMLSKVKGLTGTQPQKAKAVADEQSEVTITYPSDIKENK